MNSVVCFECTLRAIKIKELVLSIHRIIVLKIHYNSWNIFKVKKIINLFCLLLRIMNKNQNNKIYSFATSQLSLISSWLQKHQMSLSICFDERKVSRKQRTCNTTRTRIVRQMKFFCQKSQILKNSTLTRHRLILFNWAETFPISFKN